MNDTNRCTGRTTQMLNRVAAMLQEQPTNRAIVLTHTQAHADQLRGIFWQRVDVDRKDKGRVHFGTHQTLRHELRDDGSALQRGVQTFVDHAYYEMRATQSTID